MEDGFCTHECVIVVFRLRLKFMTLTQGYIYICITVTCLCGVNVHLMLECFVFSMSVCPTKPKNTTYLVIYLEVIIVEVRGQSSQSSECPCTKRSLGSKLAYLNVDLRQL